jgi:hypothetical protein
MRGRFDLDEFLKSFLQGGTRTSPELLLVFLFGLLAVGLIGNLLYDLFLGQIALLSREAFYALLGIGAMIALAFVMWLRFLDSIHVASPSVNLSTMPQKMGLIWLMSPGSIALPLLAINHHLPTLQRLWVILAQDDDTTLAALQALRAHAAEKGWSFAIEPVWIDSPDLINTRRAVEDIFGKLAPHIGLDTAHIVADITGGFKTMTAGMVLACAFNSWTLEYIATDRLPIGDPIPGKQIVVQVDIGPHD